MNIRTFLSIVEIRTKIVSLSTYSLALLYALYLGARLAVPLALLTLAAALAVDMGTTAFNNYFDYLRRVDRRRYNQEKDKVIIDRKSVV
jgi:1,4-dihydroxy-2-naphthoate polyprenyltransferase